ncbi:TetR/AcrR family transcriptional regulator [Kibdelosporangium phytohabitans]|uniref:TetR family transcriptional regulator n=1 Tax=Kibdelosporangium phytohabitans TaxID=860235 RepID=A0A0N9I496_9PSEU|nr:TetR/AcrR family transcriptional regulator [Kibdelosporangium phytohabitans]ALG10886.1 TetR family transcriptional regulator [Kibdelosporangium phytohabitans]MBE1462074.1 DNA-binding transcriptional regulator YbjK [Kibdelosporangium phytohabitans]
MRQNPERRTALLDAAIEVLAREGSRGLTLRAVDKEADVPIGTSSNYFASRDTLLTQAGARVYERLLPDEATVAQQMSSAVGTEGFVYLMREAMTRISGFRTGYLALLELRLEATRRPELREVLTKRVRADMDENVERHLASGLPGDAVSVRLLQLTLSWLILEQLTLPDIMTDEERDELVTEAVLRLSAPSKRE